MTRILALLLALASPAMAECESVTLNPAYDCRLSYEPTIRIVDFWSVDKVCRDMGLRRDGRVWGCHKGRDIVIPQENSGGIDITCQRRIFHHEHEHACGWPGDHPAAQFE